MIQFIAAIIISYLIGSIPTSIIAGRLLKGIDIRDFGSGNAGATNVYRVLGPIPAIVVVLTDAAKGVAAVLLVAAIVPYSFLGDTDGIRILCGLSAIVGHSFPIWANFRGGKGVGTAAGVMFSIIPLESFLLLILFIIVVAVSRYVSLASIMAGIFLSLILLFEKYWLGKEISDILFAVSVFISIFVLFSHHSNIKRLIQGKENKFGKRIKL